MLFVVFGLVVVIVLLGIMVKMVFVDYYWIWFEVMLFGLIVSVIDFVVVVVLLNDLGKWCKS